MPVSEALRRSVDKYDKEHYAFQTIKVRKELLQQFKQAVADRGERVNTVFREFMERYISGE